MEHAKDRACGCALFGRRAGEHVGAVGTDARALLFRPVAARLLGAWHGPRSASHGTARARSGVFCGRDVFPGERHPPRRLPRVARGVGAQDPEPGPLCGAPPWRPSFGPRVYLAVAARAGMGVLAPVYSRRHLAVVHRAYPARLQLYPVDVLVRCAAHAGTSASFGTGRWRKYQTLRLPRRCCLPGALPALPMDAASACAFSTRCSVRGAHRSAAKRPPFRSCCIRSRSCSCSSLRAMCRLRCGCARPAACRLYGTGLRKGVCMGDLCYGTSYPTHWSPACCTPASTPLLNVHYV